MITPETLHDTLMSSTCLQTRLKTLLIHLQDLPVAVLASMQDTSCALLHMLLSIDRELRPPVIFIDTGVHFPHILSCVERYSELGIKFLVAKPEETMAQQKERYGTSLHLITETAQTLGHTTCCHLRKRLPYIGLVRLHGFKCIIKSMLPGDHRSVSLTYHDHDAGTLDIQIFFDQNQFLIDQYIVNHKVPVSGLVDLGYRSVGCMTCTTPVAPGESSRAGRWRHLGLESKKLFCGLNPGDGSTI